MTDGIEVFEDDVGRGNVTLWWGTTRTRSMLHRFRYMKGVGLCVASLDQRTPPNEHAAQHTAPILVYLTKSMVGRTKISKLVSVRRFRGRERRRKQEEKNH